MWGGTAFNDEGFAQLTFKTSFEPSEAVVDPDIKVLQLGRAAAVARIGVGSLR